MKTKALEDQNMKKRPRKRKRITYSSSRRTKKSKIEPLIITTEKCCFCLMGPDKEKGTFLQDQISNIAAHQFCLRQASVEGYFFRCPCCNNTVKMKISTGLKFLQTPNETHLVTTKSVLAPVRKSARKSPLKSLIQVQPKKLGVNTNYMFRDRGENMWLESQSDLREINSTTSKTNNENRTHKVISNEDGDCHSVIDPNNNQFVNKNLEKEELDNESPKGSTADTQDRENIVESLKQTGMNTKRKPAKLSCQGGRLNEEVISYFKRVNKKDWGYLSSLSYSAFSSFGLGEL
ncbi:uncharacterized protein [Clytia hemisphaerica]